MRSSRKRPARNSLIGYAEQQQSCCLECTASPMTILNRRWVVRAIVCTMIALLAIALIIPAIPANEREKYETLLCVRCGIRKYTKQAQTVDGQVLEHHEELISTALSQWHEAHYRDNCVHIWRLNHIGSRGYCRIGPFRFRAGGSEAGSSATPQLVYLGPESSSELEDLYRKDPGACQEYIEAQLKPRATD